MCVIFSGSGALSAGGLTRPERGGAEADNLPDIVELEES